jgi:hypothetical protein
MIRRVLVGICVFSLIYSCSKEDDGLPIVEPVTEEGDGVAVTFVSNVVKQDWDVSDSTDAERPDTRVWNTTWNGTEHLGFYMIKTTDNFTLTSALYKNKEYTIDASGVIAPESSANNLMIYPLNSATTVQFVAYCPYQSSATTSNTVIINNFTDQSTQTLKEQKDFVFYKSATSYSRSGSAITLEKFKHKFSKVRIEVRQGYGGPSPENLTAELIGMPASVTVDLLKLAKDQTDPITPTNTTTATIVPEIISNDPDLVVLEAIIPPHKGSSFANRAFKFTIGSEEHSYSLNAFDFDSGMAYVFDLTLIKTPPVDRWDTNLSNCYIVAPGGNVNIPITRACTIGGMDPSTESATMTLETLWDDNDVISSTSVVSAGTGDARTFTVYATGKQGNAVVALKIGPAIYWSWHIWVTTNVGYVTTNGYNIMNRFLGATVSNSTTPSQNLGLCYQWGRKDPFPHQGSTDAPGYREREKISYRRVNNTDESDANVGLALMESIRNPMTLLSYINMTYYNWLPKNVNTLWNTSDNKKSVYDPCPAGWRVGRINKGWGQYREEWKHAIRPSSIYINTSSGTPSNHYYTIGVSGLTGHFRFMGCYSNMRGWQGHYERFGAFGYTEWVNVVDEIEPSCHGWAYCRYIDYPSYPTTSGVGDEYYGYAHFGYFAGEPADTKPVCGHPVRCHKE